MRRSNPIYPEVSIANQESPEPSGHTVPSVDERQRRVQIALRMKAARWLAGTWGKKGAIAMPTSEVAALPALVDDGITDDRLQSMEQAKAGTKPATRSELTAFAKALCLPPDWFHGLYPSDRDRELTTEIAKGLRAVADAAQALRQAREANQRKPPEEDRPKPGPGGDGR